jgi:hypothetical protein
MILVRIPDCQLNGRLLWNWNTMACAPRQHCEQPVTPDIIDLGAWLPPEVREIRYQTRQALGRDIFCPDLQPNDLANSE